jgi:calcium-independent phospholipase A2
VAGADPNYQEPVKGMTSLHIAAVTCNVGITKLLLSFDGDLTLIDTDGNTPLDIARERDGEKAMECLEVMETVMKSRERLSSDKTIDPPIHPTADSITLLSLDGGGTRGVVCAYILHYIEKQMRLKTANPNIHIRHYFDWYAASSIGSIIALSMTHSNKTTRRTMAFIVNNRHHVLAGRRLYDGSTLDNFAHAAVGDDDFRSVTTPRVLVTTVKADMDPPHLIHITNYREDPGDGREWKTWEAIRASSAAPLFFPSFEQRYVDGGILATNPTQHALHDIHVYNGNKVGLVLSLGTGRHQPSINQCIDLVKPRLGHLLSDLQKDLQFFKGLKCMLVANINNCEDVVSHSKCWCESQGGVYHRLSPPLTQKYELDEKSDEGFVLFFYETYLYVLDINDEISRITNYLISCGPKYKRKLFKSTWV